MENLKLEEIKKRLNQVVDLIERYPHSHDQLSWHCGTDHCYGGFVDLICGYNKNQDLKLIKDVDKIKFSWSYGSLVGLIYKPEFIGDYSMTAIRSIYHLGFDCNHLLCADNTLFQIKDSIDNISNELHKPDQETIKAIKVFEKAGLFYGKWNHSFDVKSTEQLIY